jgi:hypothetical protein
MSDACHACSGLVKGRWIVLRERALDRPSFCKAAETQVWKENTFSTGLQPSILQGWHDPIVKFVRLVVDSREVTSFMHLIRD